MFFAAMFALCNFLMLVATIIWLIELRACLPW